MDYVLFWLVKEQKYLKKNNNSFLKLFHKPTAAFSYKQVLFFTKKYLYFTENWIQIHKRTYIHKSSVDLY